MAQSHFLGQKGQAAVSALFVWLGHGGVGVGGRWLASNMNVPSQAIWLASGLNPLVAAMPLVFGIGWASEAATTAAIISLCVEATPSVSGIGWTGDPCCHPTACVQPTGLSQCTGCSPPPKNFKGSPAWSWSRIDLVKLSLVLLDLLGLVRHDLNQLCCIYGWVMHSVTDYRWSRMSVQSMLLTLKHTWTKTRTM